MQGPVKTYKVLLIGEGGCGKTAFVHRALSNQFEKRYIATLGVEVDPIHVSPSVVFNIWDCAGQEKFSGLGDGYYVGAQAVIFAFDLASEFTREMLTNRMQQVFRMTGNIPHIVVGMKGDLLSFDELRAFAWTNFVCSSKTGDAVQQALEGLLELL